MKLLTATTRYYLSLTAGLFALAAGLLYLGLHHALNDSLVQNLLQNVIKHNLSGGDVLVSLTPAGLEVSNPGPAVVGDPARFFERFRKHDAASDSPGLGLSIVGIKEAVPVLTVVQVFGNASRFSFGRRELRWQPIPYFLAGSLPCAILSSSLYSGLNAACIFRVVGGFLVLVGV